LADLRSSIIALAIEMADFAALVFPDFALTLEITKASSTSSFVFPPLSVSKNFYRHLHSI